MVVKGHVKQTIIRCASIVLQMANLFVSHGTFDDFRGLNSAAEHRTKLYSDDRGEWASICYAEVEDVVCVLWLSKVGDLGSSQIEGFYHH